MPKPGEWLMTCPHCSASPAPFVAQAMVATAGASGEDRRWQPASCPACGGMIVAEVDGNGHIMAAYPKETGEWEVDHLPPDVRTDWGEAVKVYRVGANASAVVACGRTLEAAADARGVTRGTLGQRVAKMQQEGLITTEFKGAMSYVRLIRNIGAHAGRPVRRESAEGTMLFTQQALRLLFEVPNELDRLTTPPPDELGEESGATA